LSRQLRKGDVVLVSLPQSVPPMHEQQGIRPAIVVGIPPGETRYLLVVIAPLTTRMGQWVRQNPVIYPKLPAGTGGLTQDSVVLLDQIRAIDAQRIVKYIGSLASKEYAPIAAGINQLLN